jgi:NAD(P)-dependent dehydrogenase (short-subunit alcohol dehydrogenase family)
MARSPEPIPNQAGKVILITGGNSGIGKEAAVVLAAAGAHVAITARDASRGANALAEIKSRSGSELVDVVPLDLADFASIRACAALVLANYDRLDVLVNNAGLVLAHRSETKQGFETTFGVNHLGHFLLTDLLRERLVASAPARVVVVASDAHKFARHGLDWDDLPRTRKYRSFGAYAQSKLANILFANELSLRLDGTDVTANSLHPGFVASNFAKEGDGGILGSIGTVLGRPFALTPAKGALTTIHVAGSDEGVERTGTYFVRSAPATPNSYGRDMKSAKRLWEVSEELIASKS